MRKHALRVSALSLIVLFFTPAMAQAQGQGLESAPTRSIRITTKEVTDPDVAVSSDGRLLVFTALGHLFQLSTTGGSAKQLTFGPYYDSAPAISPDGTSVAFISDQETLSQGNVFVLDIASGRIRRLTNEFWADRPAWSPDGKSIAFLSYQLLGPTGDYWFVAPKGLRSQVRRVGVADGKVAVLSEPGFARAVAFLADGRPVWSEVELESEKKPAMSRLAVATQAGQPTTALMVEGVADRIGVDPRDGGGLYLRLYEAASPLKNVFPQRERLAYLPLGRGRADQTVTGLLSGPERSAQGVEDRGEGARVYPAQLSNSMPRPAFGVANGSIYLGDRGKLWRVDAATGKRDEIAFSAEITFDYLPGSPPPAYANRNPASPTSILTPRLAPDGASVIFTAAGSLWRQPLAGGETRRLLDTGGFEWGPAALSPDGKKLAYQLSEGADQQLRVVDLATGRNQVLISQPRTGRYQPAWSPDGTRLVYAYYEPRATGPKVPCVTSRISPAANTASWRTEIPVGRRPHTSRATGSGSISLPTDKCIATRSKHPAPANRSPSSRSLQRTRRFRRTASGSPSAATTRSGWRRSGRIASGRTRRSGFPRGADTISPSRLTVPRSSTRPGPTCGSVLLRMADRNKSLSSSNSRQNLHHRYCSATCASWISRLVVSLRARRFWSRTVGSSGSEARLVTRYRET